MKVEVIKTYEVDAETKEEALKLLAIHERNNAGARAGFGPAHFGTVPVTYCHTKKLAYEETK